MDIPGFLIILAKLSDIFGRKPVMVFVIVIFTIFSIACGVAQTLPELYIIRWCD